MDDKKNKKRAEEPKVAPGIDDEFLGEKASRDDVRKGNATKVTRVIWDEHDPS